MFTESGIVYRDRENSIRFALWHLFPQQNALC
nr:MAG TPA: hypothetical protein [Myoviridae sp. ct1TR10]